MHPKSTKNNNKLKENFTKSLLKYSCKKDAFNSAKKCIRKKIVFLIKYGEKKKKNSILNVCMLHLLKSILNDNINATPLIFSW